MSRKGGRRKEKGSRNKKNLKNDMSTNQIKLATPSNLIQKRQRHF